MQQNNNNKKSESIYSWFAGMIDGEGSILLTSQNSKSNEFRTPKITVANTRLEFFKKAFGGYIINHGKRKKHYLNAYSWRSSTRSRTLKCLSKIYPFLRHPIKRKRALHILKFYKKVTLRNGRYSKKQLRLKKEFEKKFFQLS